LEWIEVEVSSKAEATMKMNTAQLLKILMLSFFVVTPHLPAQTATQAGASKQIQKLPLNVIGRKEFCQRLSNAFTQFGQQSGLDPLQTVMLSGSAPSSLIKEFRAGRATDFISTTALMQMTSQVLTVNYNERTIPESQPENYIGLGGFVRAAMGLNKTVNIALSTGELRFIPHAQHGIEIVVIAVNAASLTPERARKVAEVARAAGIRVHVIWAGTSLTENEAAQHPELLDEARTMAWIAAATGGSFANIGGDETPCAVRS
jgi:hypothetical protein